MLQLYNQRHGIQANFHMTNICFADVMQGKELSIDFVRNWLQFISWLDIISNEQLNSLVCLYSHS